MMVKNSRKFRTVFMMEKMCFKKCFYGAFIVCMAVFITLVFGGCGNKNTGKIPGEMKIEKTQSPDWESACETPYGKYPETVTYTLGQMTGANNSNLPEGDTYEDNAYTRYLKKMLNIQNETVYSESEDRYKEMVDILVKDRTLPDVLVVNDRETLKELVENDLVEDLTKAYEKCTTPKIKEMYKSYGDELLESVEFDGKLMAVPETVIDHGPRILWLRKDWMDELGLDDPGSLEEAFGIIEEFQKNRMGAEKGEEPIGLVCDTNLVGTTSSNFSVDPVFDVFGAKPQRWLKGEDGKIVYGSLTSETKEALACLHSLYERGILDRNFALRAQNNLRDLVVEGKCGAFFGLWWTPNNPLMDVYETDKNAEWKPYYFKENLSAAAGGDVYASFRDNKYVVVRKGYEHPEIVMKIISVLFDYTRYVAADAQEVNDYFALNVDPTARPLVINVDYNDATFKVTKNIRRAMNGEIRAENLSAIERSYYDACYKYKMSSVWPAAEERAAYESRICAVGLLVDAEYTPPKRIYPEEFEIEIPQVLQTMEKNAFIQIIMGKQDVDYFERFVEEWYEKGGES